jgi:hypothetical protein
MKTTYSTFALLALIVSAHAADPTKKSDVIGETDGVNHIALYDGSKYVLEVSMNTGNSAVPLKNGSKVTCVYNSRTLGATPGDSKTTFKPKLAKDFMGAKYVSGLSSSTLAKVYDGFRSQYLFNATYQVTVPWLKFRAQAYNSSSTYYWDAYGNKKQGSGDSVLRCDYTVVAAYLDVTGKMYGWSSNPATVQGTPSGVFKAFPSTR